MDLKISLKCLVILMLTSGQFFFLASSGATPSGTLTLFLVIINFAVVSVLGAVWQYFRRYQKQKQSNKKTLIMEEEVDDETNASY